MKKDNTIEPTEAGDAPANETGAETIKDGITIKAARAITGRRTPTIDKWIRTGAVRTSTAEDGTRLVSEEDIRQAAGPSHTIDRQKKKETKNQKSLPQTEANETPVEPSATNTNAGNDVTPTDVIPEASNEAQDTSPTAESGTSELSAVTNKTDSGTLEQNVEICSISFDEGTQIRARILTQVVNDYAEKMKARERFPLVELFRGEDNLLYIGDGWHRLLAAKKNGYHHFPANVRGGGRAAAIAHALKANIAHGARLTNADRRKKVLVALREYPGLSSNAIAEACALSESLVRSVRDTFVKNEPDTRLGADGKHYPARKTLPIQSISKKEGLVFNKAVKLAEKLDIDRLQQLRAIIERRIASIQDDAALKAA